MNRQELYKRHKQICSVALQIMQGKNVDYAHAEDPFRNFRTFGELGILVRMSDKLARLRSITENGRVAVSTESVYDTVLDLINYAILFQTFLEAENANHPKSSDVLGVAANGGPNTGMAPSVFSVPAADGDSREWPNYDQEIRPGVVVRRPIQKSLDGQRTSLSPRRHDSGFAGLPYEHQPSSVSKD